MNRRLIAIGGGVGPMAGVELHAHCVSPPRFVVVDGRGGKVDVYLLAGEVATFEPNDDPRARQPAFVEKTPDHVEAPPPLSELMWRAGERAIEKARLEDQRERIDMVFATTMPDVVPPEITLGLYGSLLQNKLGLGRARIGFEIGSSDAGADLFSKVVSRLRESSGPRTAVVIAGQRVPDDGLDKIKAIAKVVADSEQRMGITMLPIGDLLLDVFLQRQVTKAFHVFTGDRDYIQSAETLLNPDFAETQRPIHCLTTSVGGPLSQVVSTVLESRPPAVMGDDERVYLLPRFAPPQRHRFDEGLTGNFADKVEWVARLVDLYERALSELGVGVLEGQTRLRLADPPFEKLGDWWQRWLERVVSDSPKLGITEEIEGALRRATTPADVKEILDTAVPAGARGSTLRRRLIRAAVAPPVGVVIGARGRFCLLDASLADAKAGEIVHVKPAPEGVGLPLATAMLSSDRVWLGLVPAWFRVERGAIHFPRLDDDDRDTALRLARALESRGRTRALLHDARELTFRLLQEWVEGRKREHKNPVPNPLQALTRELALQSDPNRRRIAEALRALCERTHGDQPTTRYGFVEFRFAQCCSSDARAVELGETLASALRRAESWLVGAELISESGREGYSVCVRGLPAKRFVAWQRLLSFAADAYRGAQSGGLAFDASSVWVKPLPPPISADGSRHGGRRAIQSHTWPAKHGRATTSPTDYVSSGRTCRTRRWKRAAIRRGSFATLPRLTTSRPTQMEDGPRFEALRA